MGDDRHHPEREVQGEWAGDAEPEEKAARFSGPAEAEGRLKLYEKLKAGDKVALEADGRTWRS
jgi:hypothetical protein